MGQSVSIGQGGAVQPTTAQPYSLPATVDLSEINLGFLKVGVRGEGCVFLKVVGAGGQGFVGLLNRCVYVCGGLGGVLELGWGWGGGGGSLN